MAGKKAGFHIDELSGTSFPPAGNEVLVPAPTLVQRAILLTYDCEIDKDKRHRIVALVRPLTGLQASEVETIRQNRKYACFYLPPQADQVAEGYVDFRRISTISPDWLEKQKRTKSLTEAARRQMLLRLFLFFTRVQLEETVFSATPLGEEQEN